MKVAGVWQEVNYGGPNEVYIDTVDPLGLDPTAELWYDTNTTPGVLKANVGGVWTDVNPPVPPPPDEVVIATVDPYITDPTTTTELWFNEGGVTAPLLGEEIYVGTEDPLIVDPTSQVDLWYDLDEPDPPPVAMSGITIAPTLEAGWSGSVNFRVTPTTVTVSLVHAYRATGETGGTNTAMKVCNYPAGVTPPFESLFVHNIDLCSDSNFTPVARRVMLQAGTDALWVKLYSGAAELDYNANDRITCALTWAV